ncbi:hypothetical protein AOC36_01315 [Erysipelothrix larvae]|uniref:EpsG family protein n=1 Tax=Erysipelothrix larvae TaxID=1514105 RepID=A0A0X8GYC1_9FIRM|nr:EpsG family protein [Erysipelothrix larvae]AMC92677.1 hypothetical protein AOC36_01315 [Erysipelothrix larvae]
MTIYGINLILIGINAFIFRLITLNHQSDTKRKKIKKVMIGLITFQLILILAIRDDLIGVDVKVYLDFFESARSTTLSVLLENRFENGYIILNKLISVLFPDNQIFLTIIALICLIPVGVFIYRYSRYPTMSFLLYIAFEYYSFVFSGLRQSIAYAIILTSYTFIRQRKLVSFLLLIFFASLFHRSALIFVFAYFIHTIHLKKITVIALLGLNLLLFILRVPLYTWVSQSFYSSYEVVESAAYNRLIFSTVILIGCFTRYRYAIQYSKHTIGLYNYVILGCSMMMFASVGTNVMRIVDYYYIFIIVLVPEVIYSLKDYKVKVLINYGVMILMLSIYIVFMQVDGFEIVPFRFFWP